MASSNSLLSSLVIAQGPQPDTWLSTTLWKPRGARGVFGGHVIALAIAAANKSIEQPGMGLHSQHCYFVLPADPDVVIEFKVERMRDGRSYATRVVRALQNGRSVFVLAASYSRGAGGAILGGSPFSFIPTTNGIKDNKAAAGVAVAKADAKDPALSHSLRFAVESTKDAQRVEKTTMWDAQTNEDIDRVHEKKHVSWREREGAAMPPFTPSWHIPFPEGVSSYEESVEEEMRWQKFLDERSNMVEDKARKYIQEYIQERTESPVSIAVARREPGQPRNVRMIWLRARLSPDEKPNTEDIKAMIGYMTDFQFIGTAARSVGLTSASKPRLGMLATLDHTTHFYPFPPDLDASRPMLHVMEAAITDVNSGRGIVRGLVYTDKGVLIAVTSQEGVVRADMRGMGERGVTEGGGFEGKAKL